MLKAFQLTALLSEVPSLTDCAPSYIISMLYQYKWCCYDLVIDIATVVTNIVIVIGIHTYIYTHIYHQPSHEVVVKYVLHGRKLIALFKRGIK